MKNDQKQVWDILQGNEYHKWVASDLIAPSVVEKRPFLDPIMSVGFVLIGIVAIGNILTSL